MKIALKNRLSTIYSSAKQEFQNSPIKTSIAVILFLIAIGVVGLCLRHIPIIVTRTEQTYIFPLIVALVSLVITLLVLIRRNKKPMVQTLFIQIDQFKWKTEIYQNGEFKIHPIPYCAIHETRLIKHYHNNIPIYACPSPPSGCKTAIEETRLPAHRDKAYSLIEHKLKQKN